MSISLLDSVKVIEASLKGKSHHELRTEMSNLSTEALLELLNRRSKKIGDTASSLLNQRNECEQLAKAVLAGKYTTVGGKVRASNTLWFGRAKTPTSDEAFLHLSRDKNEVIAGTALLAVVAMRKTHLIDMLEKVEAESSLPSHLKAQFHLAIEALKKGDPKIFSPYYGG